MNEQETPPEAEPPNEPRARVMALLLDQPSEGDEMERRDLDAADIAAAHGFGPRDDESPAEWADRMRAEAELRGEVERLRARVQERTDDMLAAAPKPPMAAEEPPLRDPPDDGPFDVDVIVEWLRAGCPGMDRAAAMAFGPFSIVPAIADAIEAGIPFPDEDVEPAAPKPEPPDVPEPPPGCSVHHYTPREHGVDVEHWRARVGGWLISSHFDDRTAAVRACHDATEAALATLRGELEETRRAYESGLREAQKALDEVRGAVDPEEHEDTIDAIVRLRRHYEREHRMTSEAIRQRDSAKALAEQMRANWHEEQRAYGDARRDAEVNRVERDAERAARKEAERQRDEQADYAKALFDESKAAQAAERKAKAQVAALREALERAESRWDALAAGARMLPLGVSFRGSGLDGAPKFDVAMAAVRYAREGRGPLEGIAALAATTSAHASAPEWAVGDVVDTPAGRGTVYHTRTVTMLYHENEDGYCYSSSADSCTKVAPDPTSAPEEPTT